MLSFKDIDIIKFKSFQKFPDIVCGISTKRFGPIKNKNFEEKKLNKFFKTLLIRKEQAIFMNQVHGEKVVIIKNANKQVIDKTDGLVTSKKNIFLCATTADCLPILFYDPFSKFIGIVHAGYKGVLNGILDSMIYQVLIQNN
ncbi:MAG: polyphenol oxidase family protein, partial [Patescibacteria group bacterium]|nr:polyphenol oxidase family protein [Patescibacteria group bacterium]